jgi:hypothetical protein
MFHSILFALSCTHVIHMYFRVNFGDRPYIKSLDLSLEIEVGIFSAIMITSAGICNEFFFRI